MFAFHAGEEEEEEAALRRGHFYPGWSLWPFVTIELGGEETWLLTRFTATSTGTAAADPLVRDIPFDCTALQTASQSSDHHLVVGSAERNEQQQQQQQLLLAL